MFPSRDFGKKRGENQFSPACGALDRGCAKQTGLSLALEEIAEMNYQFNLEKWMAMFPLEAPHGRYHGSTITSPCHLCNNEWLRRGMQDQYDWGKPVPSDLFVMAEGEPENRFATKIGGLPYRLASTPWPVSKNGKPLFFLAQFNFSEIGRASCRERV